MDVRRAVPTDLPRLAAMRHALWPHRTEDHHRSELERALAADGGEAAVFVAAVSEGSLIGFAEAALRHDYVNGCSGSPVGFLEGVYVVPEHRRGGGARSLIAAVETWSRALGCAELASDALLDNTVSHALHKALGFAETERVVFFRRDLADQGVK